MSELSWPDEVKMQLRLEPATAEWLNWLGNDATNMVLIAYLHLCHAQEHAEIDDQKSFGHLLEMHYSMDLIDDFARAKRRLQAYLKAQEEGPK